MIEYDQGVFAHRQLALAVDFQHCCGTGESLHGVIAHDFVADIGIVPGQGIGAAMLYAPLNLENLPGKQLFDISAGCIDAEFYIAAPRGIGKTAAIRVDEQ